MIFNPRLKMQVSDKWVTETRNIYEDYEIAFGEAPPRISGVAIMSDSDNTKGSTEAYYGDIEFRKKVIKN